MIHSRITSKGQTTVPRAVREALGVGVGDVLAYEVRDGVVTITPFFPPDDAAENPFALFTEWGDELDSAYDAL